MTGVSTDVISPGKLTQSHIDRWRDMQSANAGLHNPYYAPEFTLAVGKVRSDARVAIIRQHNEIQGFFPFQHDGAKSARPIGYPVSDYQGIVSGPDFVPDLKHILSSCGLRLYRYDHVRDDQTAFQAFRRNKSPSPIIDLAQGYDAYRQQRKHAGVNIVNKRMKEKWRKLARELGLLRFVGDDRNEAALEQLKIWKSGQYRATGAVDDFTHDWINELLKVIFNIQSPSFSGILSTLYAGDRLVAVHMGMRSSSVWHYWYPSYDPEIARYSPGYRLLIEMAEYAPKVGIGTIDLGKGAQDYKLKLANSDIAVNEGDVGLPSMAYSAVALRHAMETLFESLPLGRLSTIPRRLFKRVENKSRYLITPSAVLENPDLLQQTYKSE